MIFALEPLQNAKIYVVYTWYVCFLRVSEIGASLLPHWNADSDEATKALGSKQMTRSAQRAPGTELERRRRTAAAAVNAVRGIQGMSRVASRWRHAIVEWFGKEYQSSG